MSSPSGDQYGVTLKFKSSHVGFYCGTLVFEFRSSPPVDSKPFHLVRFIEGQHTSALTEALAPVSPYRPCRVTASQPVDSRVEEGLRPAR